MTRGELLRRNRKRLSRVAAGHYAGFAAPEDLTAEVFVHLWFILRHGGGPRRRLRPYLLALMRNLATRRWFHETCDSEAPIGPDVTWRPHCDATADHHVVRSRIRNAVASAFHGLPQRDREFLVALEVDGVCPDSIAARTGLSAHAVSSLAGRARKRLHDAFTRTPLPESEAPRCQSTRTMLVDCIHGDASLARVKLFTAHLVRCAACRSVVGGLIETDHELAVAGSITSWLSRQPT